MMPWYKPRSWFGPENEPARDEADEPLLSRRAVDSDDLPMECMFSMRLPTDMREDGSRVARAHGFSSLAEFSRYLLRREIKAHFDHVDRIFDEAPQNAMQKRGRDKSGEWIDGDAV